ncbi:ribonuclease H-like domain-containing protein [Mycena leptocephala]|nr:ribonuclease H-like domain-containing protein [Mycena leptocephala]
MSPKWALRRRRAQVSISLDIRPVASLRRFPDPHAQRIKVGAELTAIILALEAAHEKQTNVCSSSGQPPSFIVTVHTDSLYAVNCLTDWIEAWLQNGWRTVEGQPVLNADLIEEAHDLKLKIEGSFNSGRVIFKWIPRAENTIADKYANDACDQAQRDMQEVYSIGFYTVCE